MARTFAEAFARFRWPWFFPALHAYERRLSSSPFTMWRARMERKEQGFADADAVAGGIDNPCLIPFVAALPRHLRKPFRDAVVADTLEATRQSDGTHLEPFCRMNVWARTS